MGRALDVMSTSTARWISRALPEKKPSSAGPSAT
jgi:hypothetical protein